MLKTEKCYCPYCGERIEIVIDLSMGAEQSYIEDCFVCCRPMVLTIFADMDAGDCQLYAATENDC